MAEFITFDPQDSSGTSLHKAVISIIDSQNQILFTEAFGVYLLALTINTVQLAPGTYTLWCRADGHIFTYPTSITIVEGDGPTAAAPRVIDVIATGTSVEATQSSSGWCRVFGNVGIDLPAGGPGRTSAGYGVVEETQYGTLQVYDRMVTMWRVSAMLPGEAATLQERERVDVSIDTNGRFEVLLRPQTLYRAAMPNIAGRQYFTTPLGGLDADIDTLIDTSKSSAPYELIGGS